MEQKYNTLFTEQVNHKSIDIDIQTTNYILTMINQEDNTIPQAVHVALPVVTEVVDLMLNYLQNGGRLIYLGAGSSGRIGMLDAAEIDPTFNVGDNTIIGLMAGGNAAFIKTVEGAEDDIAAPIMDLKSLNLTKDDVVLGIAASGQTPYVLSGLKFAKDVGALTIGLCMTMAKAIEENTIKVIRVLTGPELITGSTRMKAGTATKMVLNMISTTLMIKLGKVYRNLMIDVKTSNHKLHHRAINIVQQITQASNEKIMIALEASHYSCRHAIIMIMKNVSYEQSQHLLIEHNNFLRAIIG